MTRARFAGALCAPVLLLAALSACTLTRIYVGSPLPDPLPELEPGVTSMAEVLERYGAPQRVQRGPSGYIFVYRYLRSNTSKLAIEEPVFTDLTLFSYTRDVQREDRMVVLFDEDGRLIASGIDWGARDLDR